MNTLANAASDPTTPGGKPAPTALGSSAAGILTGTPIAIVTVWLLETYGTVHGQPLKLDAETATAIGAVGAGVVGYLTQVIHGLYMVLQDWATRTPPK